MTQGIGGTDPSTAAGLPDPSQYADLQQLENERIAHLLGHDIAGVEPHPQEAIVAEPTHTAVAHTVAAPASESALHHLGWIRS
jgi:hypothetical protein